MIIIVPTALLCIQSEPIRAMLRLGYALPNFSAKTKEPVSIVIDFKVRGPPGFTTLSYKERAVRSLLLVA